MPSTITASDFTLFATGTVIRSARVNTNFSMIRGNLLPISESTSAASDASLDLGMTDKRFRDGYLSRSMYMGPVNTAGGWKIDITTTGYMIFSKYSSTAYVKKGEWG